MPGALRNTDDIATMRYTAVLAAGCVTVALVYILQRRCHVSDAEFALLAVYLALVLAYVLCMQQRPGKARGAVSYVWERARRGLVGSAAAAVEGSRRSEKFAPDDDDNGARDLAQPANSDNDSRPAFTRFLELPDRVTRTLAPKLENIARVFKGQTLSEQADETNGDAEERDYTLVSEDTVPRGDDPRIQLEYKRIDYLLCQLKRSDAALYARVIGSWESGSVAPAGGRTRPVAL